MQDVRLLAARSLGRSTERVMIRHNSGTGIYRSSQVVYRDAACLLGEFDCVETAGWDDWSSKCWTREMSRNLMIVHARYGTGLASGRSSSEMNEVESFLRPRCFNPAPNCPMASACVQKSQRPSFHPVFHLSCHFEQSNSSLPSLRFTSLCALHIHWPSPSLPSVLGVFSGLAIHC